MDALVMRAAMSRDDYLVYRHKLVIQAELARESGSLIDFLEDAYVFEPAESLQEMRQLAFVTENYRRQSAAPLQALEALAKKF